MTGQGAGHAPDFLGYSGKSVVVTGCFSGIGNAVARLLVDCGASVHGFDIKSPDLPLASFTMLDLRRPDNIAQAAAQLAHPIHAVFNCAGIPHGGPPLDVMKVNYIGTRFLTDTFLPAMPKGSAIVNVASTGGMNWHSHLPEHLALHDKSTFAACVEYCESHPDLIAEGYRFSKEAMIVWTLKSARKLIQQGIRLNCTLPGAVQTPMLEEIEKSTPASAIDAVTFPIGRRSTSEEQAMVLLFLNGDSAAYINGAVLAVDGGFMASLAMR